MISRRFRAIAGQEFRTQIVSPLFWVLLAVIAAMVSSVGATVFIPSATEGVGGMVAFPNSQHALAANIALCTFFAYPFFACLMAGLSVIKDDDHNFSELLHSTPVSTREYLFGKWAGVLGALGIAVVVHFLLLLAFRELPVAAGAERAHGPFALHSYVVPLVLIAAPAVYWMATLAFAVGTYTRRPMAVYVVPVMFFLGTLSFTWTWAPTDMSPALDALLAVLDPSGLRWVQRFLFAEDRGLAHYNSAPLALDSVFWFGRLLALALPTAIMVLLSHRTIIYSSGAGRASQHLASIRRFFSRAHTTGSPRATVLRSAGFKRLTDLAMLVHPPGFLRGTNTVFAAEVQALRRTPSLWGFLLVLMFVVVEAGAGGEDAAGAPVLLGSGEFAVRTIPAVTVLLCLYLLFAAVELMYRDTATHFDAIGNAAPIPNASVLAGRGLALVTVIALSLSGCVAASALQLSLQRETVVELWPLVLVFGAVLAPTFLLWASFVVTVVSIVKQRTAALATGIVALIVTGMLFVSGEISWVNNWPLWGALRWSDLGVFPLNSVPLLWNRLGALALAVFFTGLTVRTFSRVEADALQVASRRSMRNLSRAALRLSPFALAPIMIAGFLSIRIDSGPRGESTIARQNQHFADNVVRWSGAPQAHITTIDATIELDPPESRAAIVGTYRLLNNTSDFIPELVFTVRNAVGDVAWTIAARDAMISSSDYLHNIILAEPLPPDSTIDVGFRYTMSEPVGMTRNGGGARSFILPAGVLLSTRDGTLLPVPGFEDLRPNSPDFGRGFNDGQPYTSHITVTAPNEYTVTSVGTQVQQETGEDLTTVVWESETPIASLNLIAGRWDQRERDGATVYFHATHDRNIDVILDAMTAARANYSAWFGVYPWSDLRLSEFPDLETNATAFPTNISMSEGLGFLARGDAIDGLAFSVVAHEVAHQWWGHLITAASGPGDGFMIEGMANYSTLLLHERAHGAVGRIAYARQLERAYLSARRPSLERGVLATTERDAGGEGVLSHRGAFVFWMLRDLIGSERMDSVVKEFAMERMRLRDDASPRVLLTQLRLVAPDSMLFDTFVSQWMERAALPELEVRVIRSEERAGRWFTDVSLGNIGTGRVELDVDVRNYRDDALSESGSQRMVRQRVQLDEGQQRRLTIATDFAPREVMLDPEVRVLQRNRERAQASIEVPAPPGVIAAIARRP